MSDVKIVRETSLNMHTLLSVLLMGQCLTTVFTSCGNSDSSSSSSNIIEGLNNFTTYFTKNTQPRTRCKDRPNRVVTSSISDTLLIGSHSFRRDDIDVLTYDPTRSIRKKKRFKRSPLESFSGNWSNRFSNDRRINLDVHEMHPKMDLATLPTNHNLITGEDSLQNRTTKCKREPLAKKWRYERGVTVEGDVTIGGLMMVHSRGDGRDGHVCGEIMEQGGLQALEVMLYTLEEINKNKSNPFKIGAHILDDCDTDIYGLEMAMDFIKNDLNFTESRVNNSKCLPPQNSSKPIWGVVGAASSITSIKVSNLLQIFQIPMISPFSTSSELSDKDKYKYFFRTIPSDYYQAKVIAEIVEKLKWTFVSIVYEETTYGIKGRENLLKSLGNKSCVATEQTLLKDSGVGDKKFNYEDVVNELNLKRYARGVIVFASDEQVSGLMNAVKHLNLTNRFSWIGSDGWSARDLVTRGKDDVVEGTISVQPRAKPVEGFRKYFLEEKPSEDNLYFAEYWETKFNCCLPYVPLTPFNQNFNEKCDDSFNLTQISDQIKIEKQLQFVHQATYGFCDALFKMHRELCDNKTIDNCPAMTNNKTNFLEFVKNVNFTDFQGDEFHFDGSGDGSVGYNIFQYQKNESQYEWKEVGWTNENGNLNFSMNYLKFRENDKGIPLSNCSYECKVGEKRNYYDNKNKKNCCWNCTPCGEYQYVKDYWLCENCPKSMTPNSNRTKCENITKIEERYRFFTISIVISAALGIVIVICTFTMYFYKFNTSIVIGSSREAHILILIGALALHVNAFFFILDPGELVCSVQSYLSGIGYVLIYGSLFWKSYRIVRVFDARKPCRKLNWSAFVLLVLAFCGIQIVKFVIWTLLYDPRQVEDIFPTGGSKIQVCSAFINVKEMGYFIAYIFPAINILICCVKTKEISPETPERFHYSSHIFFSIYFTILSWGVMFIVHLSTIRPDNDTGDILVRQNVLALITNLNGIVVVLLLSYKTLYFIIFPSRAPVDENPFLFPRVREIGIQFSTSSESSPNDISTQFPTSGESSPMMQKSLIRACRSIENKTVWFNDGKENSKIPPKGLTKETLV